MLEMSDSSQVTIASALGYLSIACWLCAQIPQVLKNISLQSCDGLALPFLCNWLFGDITNLIGCILTDQLPFQTWLAAYFCLVDFTLLAQYFYYRSLAQPFTSTYSSPAPRHQGYNHMHQSFILPSPYVTTSPRVRSASHPPLFSNPATASSSTARNPRPQRTPYSQNPSTMSVHQVAPGSSVILPPPDGSYAAIYEAALDVARAAERASNRKRSESARRLSRQTTTSGLPGVNGEAGWMVESFHSEMSAQTASTEDDWRQMSQSTGALLDNRGRSLQRAVVVVPEESEGLERLPPENGQEMREALRSTSRSLSMVRGSGGRGRGRRTAGVAFMSLGLLVGWGGIQGRRLPYQRGMVMAPQMSSAVLAWPTRHPILIVPPHLSTMTQILLDVPLAHIPEELPSMQRIMGRISAWTCTTLYLTSRLPQIWKNFTRKSVEGLSILLFIFAFLGNLLYVLSILLNPAGTADPSEADHYLLEALPYLLGSGGTLIFDLIIMLQSFVYGSAPPIASSILDRGSRRRYDLTRRSVRLEDGRQFSISSERQPLLSGSTPEHPSEQSQQSQSTHHGSLHLRRHSSSRPPDIQEDDDSTVRQE